MKQLFPFVLFVLMGCNQPTNVNSKIEIIETDISEKAEFVKSDSIKPDIKETGKSILEGETIWGKNEQYLFQLMDSILSKDSINRKFYFSVFQKICNQADGYIGEAIGGYALKFLEAYPKDFFELSENEINRFSYNIGFEIAVSEENPLDAADKIITNLKKENGSSLSGYSVKIDTFLIDLKNAIKDNLE